jgi:WhiB family redox-sensing transcriptional regulator
MTFRHFGILSSQYLKLLQAIRSVGKVPCELQPELWFPEDIANPETRAVATALALTGCQACPIMEQCFTYALEHREASGIWGGSMPHERI